jgi:hypothetical protein
MKSIFGRIICNWLLVIFIIVKSQEQQKRLSLIPSLPPPTTAINPRAKISAAQLGRYKVFGKRLAS